MLLGFIVGIGISLAALIPGVHTASLLLLILPMVAVDTAVAAACTSVGCSSMLSILGALRAPTDVAARMAQKGYTKAAIRIHAQAVWVAYAAIVVIATSAVAAVLMGRNLLQQTTTLLKPIIPLILGFALVMVILRSSRPIRTGIIVASATMLGFWTFHGSALRSNPWVMTPLLSGLFMIGPTLNLLISRRSNQPEEVENHWEVEPTVEVKGAIVGCITGFLAGIGTSSLIALLSRDTVEEDYLALQAAADAANNFFAILGFVLIGSTRSGTAAALATIAPNISVFDVIIYLLLILAGLMVGDRMLRGISALNPPGKLLALITLTATAIAVYKTTGLAGMLVLVAAWQLQVVSSQWRVPNQALLAVMIGPVLIYYLGLTEVLI